MPQLFMGLGINDLSHRSQEANSRSSESRKDATRVAGRPLRAPQRPFQGHYWEG
jgi:hypothetical protein